MESQAREPQLFAFKFWENTKICEEIQGEPGSKNLIGLYGECCGEKVCNTRQETKTYHLFVSWFSRESVF
jgi:hypothetical protein